MGSRKKLHSGGTSIPSRTPETKTTSAKNISLAKMTSTTSADNDRRDCRIDELTKNIQEILNLLSQATGLSEQKAEVFAAEPSTIDDRLTRLEAVSYTHLTLPTICSV